MQKSAEAPTNLTSSHTCLSLPPSLLPSMRDPASRYPLRPPVIGQSTAGSRITTMRITRPRSALPPGLPGGKRRSNVSREKNERREKERERERRGPISRNFLPNDVISRATRRSRDSSNSDPRNGGSGVEWTGIRPRLFKLHGSESRRVFNDPIRDGSARARGGAVGILPWIVRKIEREEGEGRRVCVN